MKKLFLLFILLFSNYFNSNSQELEYMSAREAYNGLITIDNEIPDKYDLCAAMTNSALENGTNLNFYEGTAKIWKFIFISKELSDTASYFYDVSKIDGEYKHILEIDKDGNPKRAIIALNENWLNSVDIANEIKKNVSLVNFVTDNSDSLQGFSYILASITEKYNTDVWGVSIVLKNGNSFGCIYKAVEPVQIECINPTSVEDLPTNSINIYPNPAEDYIEINISNKEPKPFA
ncbi:MAG: hypothetical protein RO257_01110 [Candidatus Kapabacteria bacterium]|nr:hypothetical protein [Candidatus Kapabacteria bacterium]